MLWLKMENVFWSISVIFEQLCNHVTRVQWLFMRGGNGGSSVRKNLAAFFTYINFHVVLPYEAMVATLAQPVEEWFLGIEEGNFFYSRDGRGLSAWTEAGDQASQEVGPGGSGRVGAWSWVLLPMLNFSSEEQVALPPHDSCQGERVWPPFSQWDWLWPALQC